MADQKTGLVITAHPGDFVWRSGGAIALHAKRGYRVKIVCLSFGERGESQFAWKEAGATLEKVKAGRRDEAELDLVGADLRPGRARLLAVLAIGPGLDVDVRRLEPVPRRVGEGQGRDDAPDRPDGPPGWPPRRGWPS